MSHQNEIQDAAALYRAILASTLDPVLTIDAHGVIQAASDSIERVFGWTPGELIGCNVNRLMPDPHHSRHDGYLAEYRATGETGILEPVPDPAHPHPLRLAPLGCLQGHVHTGRQEAQECRDDQPRTGRGIEDEEICHG